MPLLSTLILQNKRLCNYLSQFRCDPKYCPFYGNHPDSARGSGSTGTKQYSEIPPRLAELVAGWVDSEKRFRDGSSERPQAQMMESDIQKFNKLFGGGNLPETDTASAAETT